METKCVVKNKLDNNFTSASDIAYKAFQEIEGYVNDLAACPKIPTGLEEFDKSIRGGIYDTDLIVLAGRPGIGVTTVALNILNNTACSGNASVAYFSFDLSKEVLIKRLLWLMAEIPRRNIAEASLTAKDWQRIVDAVETVQKSKIFFDDTQIINIEDLLQRIKQAKESLNVDLIIIDSFNFLPNNVKNVNECSKIAYKIKKLILELRVPVIMLLQLPYYYDHRTYGIPDIRELRRFGSLVKHADIITFLHRTSYYDPQDEEAYIGQLIIARQIRGLLNIINLFYDRDTGKIKSLARCSE